MECKIYWNVRDLQLLQPGFGTYAMRFRRLLGLGKFALELFGALIIDCCLLSCRLQLYLCYQLTKEEVITEPYLAYCVGLLC
jgi:hypothetical protein